MMRKAVVAYILKGHDIVILIRMCFSFIDNCVGTIVLVKSLNFQNIFFSTNFVGSKSVRVSLTHFILFSCFSHCLNNYIPNSDFVVVLDEIHKFCALG